MSFYSNYASTSGESMAFSKLHHILCNRYHPKTGAFIPGPYHPKNCRFVHPDEPEWEGLVKALDSNGQTTRNLKISHILCNRFDPVTAEFIPGPKRHPLNCRFVHPTDANWEILAGGVNPRQSISSLPWNPVSDNGYQSRGRKSLDDSDFQQPRSVTGAPSQTSSTRSGSFHSTFDPIQPTTNNLQSIISNLSDPSFLSNLELVEKGSGSPNVDKQLAANIDPRFQLPATSESVASPLAQVISNPILVDMLRKMSDASETLPPTPVSATTPAPVITTTRGSSSRDRALTLSSDGHADQPSSSTNPPLKSIPPGPSLPHEKMSPAQQWRTAMKDYGALAHAHLARQQLVLKRSNASALDHWRSQDCFPKGAAIDTAVSEEVAKLDLRIKDLEAKIQLQASTWADTHSTYWPFEPLEGQFLPLEEQKESIRYETQSIREAVESMSEALVDLRATTAKLQEEIASAQEAELASAVAPQRPTSGDVSPNTPQSEESLYSASGEEFQAFLERKANVVRDAHEFLGMVSDAISEMDVEKELSRSQSEAAMAVDSEEVGLGPSASGEMSVPESAIQLRTSLNDRMVAVTHAIDNNANRIVDRLNIETLAEEDKLTADLNHYKLSNEMMEKRLDKLEIEAEEEEYELKILMNLFQTRLDELYPSNPPPLPLFDEVVSEMVQPIVDDLTRYVEEEVEKLKAGTRGTVDAIHARTTKILQASISTLGVLQGLMESEGEHHGLIYDPSGGMDGLHHEMA